MARSCGIARSTIGRWIGGARSTRVAACGITGDGVEFAFAVGIAAFAEVGFRTSSIGGGQERCGISFGFRLESETSFEFVVGRGLTGTFEGCGRFFVSFSTSQ